MGRTDRVTPEYMIRNNNLEHLYQTDLYKTERRNRQTSDNGEKTIPLDACASCLYFYHNKSVPGSLLLSGLQG